MRLRVLAVLAALLLAGCANEGEPRDTDLPPGTVNTSVRQEAFFTPDMKLAPVAPADASAVRSGSFFQAWAEGDDYPTWLTDPLPQDASVTNLSVQIFLRSTGPVVESGRFPDLMVYGGAGGSWIGFASTKFASVLVPQQVYEVNMDLAVPEGGLIIPAGETFGLKVVPVMHQNDQADIEILVGGEQASRAAWTWTPVALPELALVADGAAGQTAGSAYAGAAAPQTTRWMTEVEANETPRALLVWMNTTESTGVPDIDLSVIAPDGTEIASSGTPTPREFVRLSEPNLSPFGAGTYTIVVTSYGSARSAFTVDWRIG